VFVTSAKILRAAILEKRKLLDQQTDIKSASHVSVEISSRFLLCVYEVLAGGCFFRC